MGEGRHSVSGRGRRPGPADPDFDPDLEWLTRIWIEETQDLSTNLSSRRARSRSMGQTWSEFVRMIWNDISERLVRRPGFATHEEASFQRRMRRIRDQVLNDAATGLPNE